jgi:hypothetical protein
MRSYILLKLWCLNIELAVEICSYRWHFILLIHMMLLKVRVSMIFIINIFMATLDKLMQVHAHRNLFMSEPFAIVTLMMLMMMSFLILPETLLPLSLNLFVHVTKLIDDILSCYNRILPFKYGIVDCLMVKLQCNKAVTSSLVCNSLSHYRFIP